MNQMSQVRALRDVASLIDGGETLEAMLQRLIEAASQHAGWVMGSIMAIDTQLISKLLAEHGHRPQDIAGENGLLKQMVKA